jgi:3',5'-cyclic-AMP phosphodiesterase
MNSMNFSRREFLKLGGLSLLGTAMNLNFGTKVFASPTGTPFDPVRFAVVSDAHIDIKGKNAMKMSAISSKCVERTVADLNAEKDLAFVMVTGDLLQDGEVQNAREIKKYLDQLTAPYYVLSGNHDYVPADPKNRREGFTYMTIEEFVKFFNGHGYGDSGKRYYSLQVKPGLRLIALDACLPLEPVKWGAALPEDQLKWLDNQLTEHANELSLIFMHHNFVSWSADEQAGGPKQWFGLDNASDARAILSKHANAAPVAISGHRHIGLNYKEVDGVTYFIAPALNSHPMRYSVFTISHQAIAWKTPMVSVSESNHVEARENLLKAKWWRATQYEESSSFNDAAVLELYENNRMIVGSKKI